MALSARTCQRHRTSYKLGAVYSPRAHVKHRLLSRLNLQRCQKLQKILCRLRIVHRQATRLETKALHTYEVITDGDQHHVKYQNLNRIFHDLRPIHREATKLETRALRTYDSLIAGRSSACSKGINNAINAKESTNKRKHRLLPRTLPGARRLLYPYDIYTQTPDRVEAMAARKGPFYERWEAGEKYWESTGETTD